MSAARPGAKRRRRSPRWVISAVLFVTFSVLIAFANRPLRVYYHVNQGRRALSDGKYGEALATFHVAQEVDPKNSEVSFWLARASRKTGDLAGVQKYLAAADQLGFRDKKRLENEWWLLLAETGRIRETEKHLAQMLMNPGDDGAEICDAFSKGFCLNLMFTQAHKMLDVWAAEYPQDYRPYLRRGQIYAGSKQWVLAIAELREAQKRAPSQTVVHRELGHCLYKNDESKEAEEQLQQVISREPTDVPALMTLAQMAFDQNEQKRSLVYLERIVATQPQDFPARLLLAKVHLGLGDSVRSVDIAESLIEEWPEDLSAHYVLAQALRAAGRLEDAKREFVVHGELDKKWTQIETIGREMNQHPSDPQLRYELGLLLLRHVSRSEGVTYLESVFQFVSTHPDAHRALADYYEKIGNQTLSAQHRQLADPPISAASTLNPSPPRDRQE